MNVKVYFLLLRPINLALICYIQFLIHFVLFKSLKISSIISFVDFLLICLATIFITAAGNIINDIKDVVADRINRPDRLIVTSKIALEDAKWHYRILNVIGLFLGVIVGLRLEKPSLFFMFLVPSLLLYFYAAFLKAIPLLGNVTIALLVAFAVLILGFVELRIADLNSNEVEAWIVLTGLGSFAFILNLIREIVKDIIDIRGDYKQGIKSLPIVLGIARSRTIALVLLFVTLAMLLGVIVSFSNYLIYLKAYLIATVLLPLLIVTIKFMNRDVNASFQMFNIALKMIMFLGMTAILYYLI